MIKEEYKQEGPIVFRRTRIFKSMWGISDDTRKKFPLRPFTIKRTKYNEWFIFRDGDKFRKDPIDEYDIDNQIAIIKDIIRIQRKVKTQDILVEKDLDNGFITINIKKEKI
jgi:hypothetical protein